jgi:hypothetical protein
VKRLPRLLVDNLVPLILAIAAMVSTAPGPVEWTGICDAKKAQQVAARPATAQSAFDECKAEVRLKLLLAAFVFKFVLDTINHQFPLWQLTKFRRVYLDSSVKSKWEELRAKYRDCIRINIMVARRRWWLLWLYGSFDFEYPLGFSTPNQHRDMRLHLWWHQGVAGAAFRSEQPKVEYLPPGAAASSGTAAWGLSSAQRKKTDHVRWVLSVPMYREGKPGEAERPKVTGVINIDVTDDDVARRLLADTAEVATITTYFLKVGRVASHLW